MTQPDTTVAEIVRFRAAAGLADATLLAAAKGTEAALRQCPGFQTRHLTLDDTGQWTDIVLWDSPQAAQAGAEAMMRHPDFAPFMAAIDHSTLEMHHGRVIWSMPG
jgi:hypothetical protein